MKRTINIVSRKRIAALLVAVLCLTAATLTGACKKESRYPRVNIAPPALSTQPEPDDNGLEVVYTVNRTFSSDMVVQRNAYFNVFGRSENVGGVLYGEFMGEKRYGIVADDGSWTITFSSHEATAEPQTLTLYPKNGKTTEFTDILVGDVWVITGQSNSDLTYASTQRVTPEYDIEKDDLIRIYSQTRQSVIDALAADEASVTTPQEDTVARSTRWAKTSRAAVQAFSALGYYFGKELSRVIDVPLGLVMAGAGGSTLHELMTPEIAAELGFVAGAAVPVSGYYNTLIHPFTRNKITGMVFYQGESESGGDQYKNYARNLKRTVEGYRDVWELEFPFINVQLSSHDGEAQYYWPQLPEIRAAQFDAYRIIPNSYIVTAMDQGFVDGDPDWAHPIYKFELGKRAAKIAAFVSYGVGDEDHALAPEPDKITFGKDNTVTIRFKHVGDGITLLSGDTVKGLYARDEYGDKMFCDIEMVDAFTIKLTATREVVSVSYAMFPDGSVENANIGSSDGIPMPAFLIYK